MDWTLYIYISYRINEGKIIFLFPAIIIDLLVNNAP